MSSPFDGLAAALNNVFGAAVTLVDLAAVQTTVQAVFRFMPVDVDSADGRPITITVPTLRVRGDLAPNIAAGWIIRPAAYPDQYYRVLRVEVSNSPAADAFKMCVLEKT